MRVQRPRVRALSKNLGARVMSEHVPLGQPMRVSKVQVTYQEADT